MKRRNTYFPLSKHFILLTTFLLLFSLHTQAQTWTGATDDDWNKMSNWEPMTVPDGTINVVIDNVSPNPSPVIKNGTNALAQKVSVNANAQLTINSGSTLTINGSVNNGIANRGTTINNGTIIISNVTTNGIYSLEGASFTNNGMISIDDTGSSGIINENPNTEFSNSGSIIIGANQSISQHGIFNLATAIFTNEACGTIKIFDIINNTSAFTNNGAIFLETTEEHTVGDFTNNGLIGAFGSSFNGATNNEIIIGGSGLDCATNTVSPAFDLAAMPNFTIDGVFLDENAMQSGGTYDQSSNTFTLDDINILNYYVKITDNDNSCTSYITKWKTNPLPTFVDCPDDIIINSGADCEAVATWTEPEAIDNCGAGLIASTASAGDFSFTYEGTLNGHYYYKSNEVLEAPSSSAADQMTTFAAAQAAAATLGGYIVTIDDANENTFIQNISQSINDGLIIGYTDEAVEGTFDWVGNCCGGNGTAYTNWRSGEPNDIGGEDYTRIGTAGDWFDVPLHVAVKQFVIELNAPLSHPSANYLVRTHASGDVFSVIASETVTYTATSISGNTATCSFTVTVQETEDPSIECPDNISVNLDAGLCTTMVDFEEPMVADNCGDFGPKTIQRTGHNNGQRGVMFDINATKNIIITGFDMFVYSGTSGNYEIYYKTGTHVGSENSAANWTLVGTVNNLNSLGENTLTPIPLTLDIIMEVGETYGFYVTNTGSSPIDGGIHYANNANASSNDDLTISATRGKGYPFGGNFNPRGFRGRVHYIGNDLTAIQEEGLASGSEFPVGITNNVFVTTDGSGNMSNCNFTVTVNDAEAPSIECPDNMMVNTDADQCTATVNFTAPVGTDDCDNNPTTALSSDLGAGDIFPLGETTVSYQVTDASNLTDDCSFTITVVDNQNPSITCPDNMMVNTDTDQCTATVNFTVPVGTDNCDNPMTTLSSDLGAGDVFPLGETTVSYQVTDAANLTDDCSFTVTVVDNQNPSITCPDNMMVNTDTDQCNATVNFTAPVGTDNCDNPMTTLSSDSGAGDVFPLGETTVSYQVTDAANLTDDCSFTITVVDNQNPSITCPDNMMVNNEAGQSGATVTFTPPMGTDNCTGAMTVQTSDMGTGDFFPFGTTTVSYQVTDAANLTDDCSFIIEISDNEVPEISCPDNISVNNSMDICGAVVNFDEPVGTDNAPGAMTTQTSDLGNGDEFPVGMTTVSFEVTDAQSQSTNCSFMITVTDIEAPSIDCPDNMMVDNTEGQSGAIVTFDEPTGTDNCTNAMTAQTSDLGSGDFFPIGMTTLSYQVTDAANLSANCSFTITVQDNVAPQISCPDNIVVNTDAESCNAIVTFQEPIGTDNAPGAMTTQTSDLGNGDVFPLGITTVSFEVTDAQNQSTNCSFTITVNDNEMPQIDCPENIIQNNDAGQNGAIVIFDTPVGTDNCVGENTTQTSDLGSGDFFSIGTMTVSFEVTDAANLSADCSFTITINDNEAPQINCPDNIVTSNDAEDCGAVVNFDTPVGTDNTAGAMTIQTSNLGSGDFFSVGTTTVSFGVTDAANLMADCSFTVTVNDIVPPSVTDCFSYQYITMTADCEAILPDYRSFATMIDNCSDDANFSYVQTPNSQFEPVGVGQQQVLITATDPSNNSSACTVELNICPPSSLTITNVEMNEVAGGNYNSISEQLADCIDVPYNISDMQMLGNAGERNAFATLTFDMGDSEIMDCIIVASETGGALAVQWLNFDAKATPRYTVDLAWQVRTDETVDFFSIERSTDGIHFEAIDQVEIINSNINITRFEYEDKTPFRGDNYYRILQNQADGSVKGSPIRLVTMEGEGIALFPNPTNNRFQLILPEMTDKALPFQIFSIDGRLIYQGELAAEQQRFEWTKKDLNMNGSGIYFIKIQLARGKVEILKLSVVE